MNYKIKLIDQAPEYNDQGRQISNGKMVATLYEMNDFENIFSAECNDDSAVLNFKSPLGKMVFHNSMILDTDWILEKALTLKKNAYFIYKRFILNRVSGKNKARELVLWYEEIKTFLDLNWKNNSGSYAIIEKAFKEMQEKGLIQGFEWNRRYAKQRQYRVSFENHKKELEKKQSNGPKLLKVSS